MAYGKITAKQQEILDYIKDEILKRGYPPAVREICEAVNLKSTSSVHSHLETLEKNGYIRRDPTKPRAIEICDDNFQMVRTEMVSLPVVGQVAAGQPILAEENIDMVYWLLQEINENYPDKTIWLYTGYTWEQLFEDDNFGIEAEICENQTRRAIVLSSDVLVDGQYIDSQRDISLHWTGSSNQRVISIKKSLEQNKTNRGFSVCFIFVWSW